ncbi:MAG: glycoside hydrolase [Actinomycetota bacterium]|nr:glycoside hydrolase [Actinomycetota bacterium]
MPYRLGRRMVTSRRLTSIALLVALVSLSSGIAPKPAAGQERMDWRASSGPRPVFEQRYVAESNAWEPTIGFGPDGAAYYVGSDTTFQGVLPPPAVYKTVDEGRTWENVSPWLTPLAKSVPPPVRSAFYTPPMSGDPYLHVDPDTGRVFSYHQQAYLFCDSWSRSADGGETWKTWDTCNEAFFEDVSWGDHPTITTGPPRVSKMNGYPNVVYFCSSWNSEEITRCRRSLDGGETWEPLLDAMTKCGGLTGHVKTAPDGTVYLPRLGCDAAWINISRDDGQTWTTVKVDDTVWTEPGQEIGLDHEAHVAIDQAGNVYYMWLGDNDLPYISVSRDEGKTWSPPVNVAAPGVTAANFPHIVAGKQGRIAVMYLGSKIEGGYDAEDMSSASWDAYVGFSLNALSPRPVFAATTANPSDDPLKRGNCFERCMAENSNPIEQERYRFDGMYDFLDMDLNPVTGAIWIALVDLCNDACATRDGTSDNTQFARAAVSVQLQGPRLLSPTD